MRRSTISIHALLAESDYRKSFTASREILFLSTLSLRRATSVHRTIDTASKFLSTLSLRRATKTMVLKSCLNAISIHALLAESDGASRASSQSRRHFYPRSPCGERLVHLAQAASPGGISIHALLAESDATAAATWRAGMTFLSTLSLRRATAKAPADMFATMEFLSTLSLRRATAIGRRGTA